MNPNEVGSSPIEYFGIEPIDVARKITEFSDLEIQERHQGVALSLLLSEDNVSLPPVYQYFMLKGMKATRTMILENSRDEKQLEFEDVNSRD